MIINQCVILFHSSAKLIANDSDNDESFGSIYQVLNCYAKNKNPDSKDWIAKTILEHGLNIFKCYFRQEQ